MLSAYLVRLIEQHADTLTNELVEDLVTNERTPSFRRLSRDEIHHSSHHVYQNLADWLADKSDAAIQASFEAVGRQRFHEQVPLNEFIWAIVLVKRHLRDKIRAVGNVYSALELHNEIQLSMMIGRFIDKVLYAVVTGYEQARTEAEHPAKAATQSRTPLERSPAKINWVP
jgi:hypothetical protein